MSKTILLIEDHPDMRENTAEILELANYDVVTAENGKFGVAKAQELDPDLIICDIMMPELDGYGVLYLLSKDPRTAAIPFIFLTAKTETTDMRKGMNLGADDYLTKPYDEMELLNAVESRLKRSELLKESYGNSTEGLNQFLSEVKDMADLTLLTEERKERLYKKKDMVYLAGDFPNKLYFVDKGKVKTHMSNEDGKELITGIYGPGEFFGYQALLQEKDYMDSASALEETQLTIIPREDFFQLLYNNRDVAHKFIRMLSNNVYENEERLLNLAYDTVRKRVADGLLNYFEKSEETQQSEGLSVSRDDLAKIVGTATESVIRSLSEFKADGYIEIDNRKIKIVDKEGLQAIRF